MNSNDNPIKFLNPAFSGSCIPVVFAANNNYVPIFATCFQSLINCSSKQYNYDVVLLHSDISGENEARLLEMSKGYDNISLRLYDVNSIVNKYHLHANLHISVETYYRLLIQDILPTYSKILYIDCDLIIKSDISKLYEIDVDGYMLGATYDIGFIGQYHKKNANIINYVKNELHLADPYNYFQAGVILFNETEMKQAHSLDEWLSFAQHSYMYNDQDVLNIYCEGHVKPIDMSWNVVTDCNKERIKNDINYAPDNLKQMYFEARENPNIIHYAGYKKPWFDPLEDFAELFWEIAKTTPFYDELIQNMNQYLREQKKFRIRPLISKLSSMLFPVGTKRRNALNKVLHR